MIRHLPMLSLLTLAACQSEPATLVKQEPGSWTASYTLDSFDIPQAPPNYKADLETALKQRTQAPICLSPEQAKSSDLVSALIEGQNLKNCDYEENDFAVGKLTVSAVCEDPKGRSVEVSINGTAAADKADVVIDMAGDEQADNPMSIALHAVLQRQGDCGPAAPPAKSANK